MVMVINLGEPAPRRYFTAEMVRALPEDGNRHETVYGELLVTPAPSPWHEEIVARLFEGLRQYARQQPVGHVFASRSDISWSPETLVQPDLLVVPLDQARTLAWSGMNDLRLVIEVLSPSSARADRFTKRRLYQEASVPLYWVVDPDERVVEVWTPDARLPAVEKERVTWWPAGAAAPFVLPLEELFRPI
jgi:Uma2 family endonuclease